MGVIRCTFAAAIRQPESYSALISGTLTDNQVRGFQFIDEANRRRLAQNRQRADALGSPRPGRSWLGGLVSCGRCGARMLVCYPGAGKLQYRCTRAATDYGKPACQTLSGECLEALVAEQILQAVEPATLELSFAAAAECARQRDEAERAWQLRLERARQEVERAPAIVELPTLDRLEPAGPVRPGAAAVPAILVDAGADDEFVHLFGRTDGSELAESGSHA